MKNNNGLRLKLIFIRAFLAGLLTLTAFTSDAGIDSFGYQLQDFDQDALRDSHLGLVIVDYSSDGTQDGALTHEAVDAIRSKTGKKVVAYLSIGEAEDYRYYFVPGWIRGKGCPRPLSSSAPKWLDKENSAWCGNFKVRYWDARWQKIILGGGVDAPASYLDRIIDAGFDGVYLDIIDGYEYWRYEKPRGQRKASAAYDMANFVIKISQYARQTRGKKDFLIIPQNGEGIIDEIPEALVSAYFDAIDAIGSEDAFFPGHRDENNAFSPREAVLSVLDRYRKAGKTVLSIEYLTDPVKIGQFKEKACARGFIPQVAYRALDSLDAETLIGCN